MRSPLKIVEDARRSWGTPNTAGVSIPHELGFDDVGFRIGDIDILRGITLRCASGSVTCLLGPSGSGKSTLLRIAAGMERSRSGTVRLDGDAICASDVFVEPERRGIGLVFQDYALFPHLTIFQNVAFGLNAMTRVAAKQQATRLLGRVGLDDRAHAYPHQLSGGEQQRVALARALAPRPGVLLMDEPFSGLDARLRDTMRDETVGILRETRATSVIVTHDPEEALRMGDQIALLHEGRLEQAGTGRELFYAPDSLFVAGFFSELNVFRTTVTSERADTPLGPVAAPGLAEGTLVDAAIRTEAIDLSLDHQSAAISATIVSTHFAGDHDFLRIGVPGIEHPIRARYDGGFRRDAVFAKGDRVGLRLHEAGCFVFPA